jgi:hypothetical protein
MANLILSQPIELYPSHLAATPVIVSATSQNASFPATNLFTYDPYEIYSTNSVTANTVVIDYGSVREMQAFALLHTNLPYTATWSVEVSPDNSSYTVLVSGQPAWCNLSSIPGSWSGEDNDPRRGYLGYAHSFYMHPTVLTTHRYVRYTTATSSSQVHSLGRLFVGKVFQPTTNYAYGAEIAVIDKSERVDMPRSAPLFNRLGKTLQFTVTLEFATQTEMEEYLYELSYWAANNREVMVCLDPTTVSNRHKRILYGTFDEGLKIIHAGYNIFEQKLVITGLY